MLGTNLFRKSLTFFTAVAVLCVYSTVALAQVRDTTGEITVSGQVTINGQSSVSNSTVTSGSTIVTGSNSTAVVSLGKNGRVELLPDTTLSLRFSGNSIVASLNAGKVRVSNAAGIASTVTTRNATVVADAGQANVFSVDIGCGDDLKCAQTFVETASGLVTLRSGTTDKQVAAGTDAVAGNASQTGCKPCLRPGSAPPTAIAGIGTGALAALLIAAGAAVGSAIFFGSNNDVTLGGGGTIVSPVR